MLIYLNVSQAIGAGLLLNHLTEDQAYLHIK